MGTKKSRIGRLPLFGAIGGAVMVVAILAANYLGAWGPVARALAADPRNSVVMLWARFQFGVDSTVLILDLRDVREASGADLYRVLFQSAKALEDGGHHFRRVVLARSGKAVFFLNGEDFATLGKEFAAEQNPVYLIRTLPEKLHLPSGEAAYQQWEGGWLGVLGKQLDDVNDATRRWAFRADGGSSERPSNSSAEAQSFANSLRADPDGERKALAAAAEAKARDDQKARELARTKPWLALETADESPLLATDCSEVIPYLHKSNEKMSQFNSLQLAFQKSPGKAQQALLIRQMHELLGEMAGISAPACAARLKEMQLDGTQDFIAAYTSFSESGSSPAVTEKVKAGEALFSQIQDEMKRISQGR